MLAAKQRAELLSIVSMKNGKPIKTTDLRDPHGFGLGVAQITTPQTGMIWFYKGMTFGYRMLHLYLPRQDAVIAFGLNSQPGPKQDQYLKLALTIYRTLHAAEVVVIHPLSRDSVDGNNPIREKRSSIGASLPLED